MAEDFKPGDVVELKSGGPAMTVEREGDEKGKWVCIWFINETTKTEGWFRSEALKKKESSGGPRNISFGR